MNSATDSTIDTGGLHEEAQTHTPWKLRFWSIFAGQGLSMLGSAVTQFVLLWWITDNTGKISALGLAGLAALLPQALLGPLGGVIADRYSRQIIMLMTDTINAVCALVLVILFQVEIVELWQIYVLMAIRSAMQAFQTPAAMASVSMLVPPSFVPRAAGLNQSIQGVILIGAAPVGALAMATMPIGWALSIDIFTASLGSIPLLLCSIPQTKEPSSQESRSVWRQFREGFRAVWEDQGLRHLYGLITVTALIVMPLFTLVPMLVKVHFRGGSSEVALLESMSGIGMIIGGGIVAAIAPVKKVPWILGGFIGACLFVAMTAGVPRGMFWLASAMWMIAAMFNIMANGALIGLIQGGVPNRLQGRVISLLTTLMGLASPFGMMLVIPLGELIGTRWLFVALGIAGAIIVLIGSLSSSIRIMDKTTPKN